MSLSVRSCVSSLIYVLCQPVGGAGMAYCEGQPVCEETYPVPSGCQKLLGVRGATKQRARV